MEGKKETGQKEKKMNNGQLILLVMCFCILLFGMILLILGMRSPETIRTDIGIGSVTGGGLGSVLCVVWTWIKPLINNMSSDGKTDNEKSQQIINANTVNIYTMQPANEDCHVVEEFLENNGKETFVLDESVKFSKEKTKGKIKILAGQYANACFEVGEEEIIMGRDDMSCHLIFKDPGISRIHCSVRYEAKDGQYYVKDYSTHGTFISGGMKLTKNHLVACPQGTVVTLGNSEERFLLQ